MSDTLKPGRMTSKTSSTEDPFELPRSIAQQLKKCVEKRNRGSAPKAVKYLWINLAAGKEPGGPAARLSVDDWLNVLDEAASIGVGLFVVCLGDNINAYPDLWKICGWAQETHEVKVGLHVKAKDVKAADLKGLRHLDPGKTWVFLSKDGASAKKAIEKAGYYVCDSEVHHAEPAEGCEGPENLLFIGPDGMVYCCGVMLGNKSFKLGHVLEQPIENLLNSTGSVRRVPKGFVRPEGGCDGCPNKMAGRMMKE